MKPSLTAQIAEVKREIALRENVYPGLVRSKRMKQEEADIHMANMVQVLRTLEWIKTNEAGVRASVKAQGGEELT